MEQFTKIVTKIDDLVWGVPLIVLILTVGIFMTIRLRGLQISKLPKALKYMVRNEDGGKGEVSSFGALCTALSATIGTGNIVGVATAICAAAISWASPPPSSPAGPAPCSGCGLLPCLVWQRNIRREY